MPDQDRPPPGDADDADAVAADEQLVENLRAGAAPPTGDQLGAHLAAWRDDARHDAPDDALGGDLGAVTDGEWLAAHERLIADLDGLVPPEQLAYTWDPTRPPAAYIGADEVEPAPQAGEWVPWEDERFTGGGFRG